MERRVKEMMMMKMMMMRKTTMMMRKTMMMMNKLYCFFFCFIKRDHEFMYIKFNYLKCDIHCFVFYLCAH